MIKKNISLLLFHIFPIFFLFITFIFMEFPSNFDRLSILKVQILKKFVHIYSSFIIFSLMFLIFIHTSDFFFLFLLFI